jgi:hypothetical protein
LNESFHTPYNCSGAAASRKVEFKEAAEYVKIAIFEV